MFHASTAAMRVRKEPPKKHRMKPGERGERGEGKESDAEEEVRGVWCV
jgi:hypothetical protein